LASKKRRIAVALLSGGLDSTLAAKLMIDQGVAVEAISFLSPFSSGGSREDCAAVRAASKLGVRLKLVDLEDDYFEVVKNPKYGYGKNLNPCIDCKIFMLKKAKEYADVVQADFFVTGEVLGQRPMSQYLKALNLIEQEAGLEGKLLRPLSARLLPETEAERKGWVKRKLLLDLRGRGRRRQMDLAEVLGIVGYPSPAGGCLLTEPLFCVRLKDLLEHGEALSLRSVSLLKIGRHFRFGLNMIIVGRNEKENQELVALKSQEDYLFEVPDCGSPTTLLSGPENEEALRAAASITARYSDAKGKKILVMYGCRDLGLSLIVSPSSDKDLEKMRVR